LDLEISGIFNLLRTLELLRSLELRALELRTLELLARIASIQVISLTSHIRIVSFALLVNVNNLHFSRVISNIKSTMRIDKDGLSLAIAHVVNIVLVLLEELLVSKVILVVWSVSLHIVLD